MRRSPHPLRDTDCSAPRFAVPLPVALGPPSDRLRPGTHSTRLQTGRWDTSPAGSPPRGPLFDGSGTLHFSRPRPANSRVRAPRTATSTPTCPGVGWACGDAQAGMPLGQALGATCVQRLDDSRNSAIHTRYRISLRSSSLQEPRYPLLRVVLVSRLGPLP